MRRFTNTKHNEQGFASIIIALVLIIVLALLTVGFAQLARREQQNALNKQLASQANYAAESGYNAAYQDIKSGAINNDNASDTNCMNKVGSLPSELPAAAKTATQIINSSNGVSVTCLLVTLKTSNLEVSGMQPGTGKHVTFGTDDPLDTITIKWGSDDNHTHYPDSYSTEKFPTLSNWKDGSGNPYPPIIQFSLTPTSSLDESALADNTFNAYLYPSKTAPGNVAINPANPVQVIEGDCDPADTSGYPCHVTLTGLNNQTYVLHVLDYYDTSNILITGTTQGGGGGGGGAATFTGEPSIDVTGKAQGVLKRLQYRVFTHGGNGGGADDNAILPNGAIEAQNICKRIQAAPPTADFPQGSTYDPPSGGLGCSLSD